jgi:hypothetical protein
MPGCAEILWTETNKGPKRKQNDNETYVWERSSVDAKLDWNASRKASVASYYIAGDDHSRSTQHELLEQLNINCFRNRVRVHWYMDFVEWETRRVLNTLAELYTTIIIINTTIIKEILISILFFSVALQSFRTLAASHMRFLELFRHMVGLLGRVISPSQGLYLHKTTQHKKTRGKHPWAGFEPTILPTNLPRPTPETARPLWPAISILSPTIISPSLLMLNNLRN